MPDQKRGNEEPTRLVGYKLTAPVEAGLMKVLHEIEVERGRRVSWDVAFRRLLAMAGRPMEEEPET